MSWNVGSGNSPLSRTVVVAVIACGSRPFQSCATSAGSTWSLPFARTWQVRLAYEVTDFTGSRWVNTILASG